MKIDFRDCKYRLENQNSFFKNQNMFQKSLSKIEI